MICAFQPLISTYFLFERPSHQVIFGKVVVLASVYAVAVFCVPFPTAVWVSVCIRDYTSWMCFASFVCLGACVYVLEFCVKLVQTKTCML